MTQPVTSDPAQVRLLSLMKRIARLRATGPNPFDYWIWADETRGVIEQVYGESSEAAVSFAAEVGARGRTPDTRGQADNMTLGLHGEWGIWSRLDRAELILGRLLGS